MNAAKWVAALGLLASGSVVAQATEYDYQGAVMTGLGAPEILTAQIKFHGPINNEGTDADVSVNFSGTYSGLYVSANCPIFFCATPGQPLELQINQTNGQFVSADISFSHAFLDADVAYLGQMAIGRTGDSLALADPNQTPIVAVANATPGVWTKVAAPELNAGNTFSAMTLLVVSLLILTGRRHRESSSTTSHTPRRS